MRRWLEGLKQLRRYPSAVLGMLLILFLVGLSVYTVVAIPYSQALDLWRGGDHWRMHPVNASPVWADRLRGGDLPETQIISSDEVTARVQEFPGGRRLQIPLGFDYQSSAFPSELNLFLRVHDTERPPFVRFIWQAPDGSEQVIGGRRVARDERVSISQDWGLERRLGHVPHVGLMMDPGSGNPSQPEVLTGIHTMLLDVVMFDEAGSVSADLVVYGRVHGIAGTDHQRRDLMVALMWGTPVALAFGLIAAVGTTVTTLVIAAMGVWFRGWVDATIQRLTEVNMILPMLPILVMVGTLYSTSIWLMLGVVVALGIFSAGIKMYRAMLLPIREAPYIEAAKAYGAGDARIILRYMVPRVLPVLIPTFVTLIPTFVFLEASLAVLGLGDPVLPTWGKVLNDAQEQSALYNGFYYWVVSPAALLMLTGLGFAMLGFALDRVFNPRLRSL
ncbi:ABC transporter permease [Thioalkalivibrio denitrificans]|uniref:ABC transporter permease n=1 Tax=Thioalkalivibrio denitrificans TaxID=108003 RepID=A0A1V3NRQ8_9GAMM|nr:ABC transporter permease [Thioalkalivibrio denitrificans]OOG27548.1 ABC transporter permease [Thioalkalivibrio denitrificans]